MSDRESVWNTAPTSAPAQRANRYVSGSNAHPAKMLPAIAAHAIRTYTKPGELVLDPMCGIGTTLVEAIRHHRQALGVEYETRWARIARANIAHSIRHVEQGSGRVVCGDARQLTQLINADLHGKVALVVTSPPYGRSAHGRVHCTSETGERGVVKTDYRYGRDPHNLAHVSTDQLLDGFSKILTQCRAVLRPGGTVVVTTRPWRTHGELIDLPSAVLATGQAAGLVPAERCVALLAGIRDGRLIARPSFFQLKNVRDARRQGIPLHLVQHEDVLIFTRPEKPSAASWPLCARRERQAGTERCRYPRSHRKTRL
ncbi:TRM11 family SAM-dependent methyltransferase [Streptomyces malaysiensis]|uniref:Methyltransferase n=1 Tax=Streptomyces malaysiensis subsp. samsunensis TaxID=459658 RepID=A0A9X2S0D9_STRMQ|nr:site-specific DNA-methyltransferase [Streptomyces samsunensis]MCQ8835320.1 site-specific DNA-methyltransferase [Streptomyces samsunensis]